MTDRIGKKGFTLVELLVVIAMLMLLAGAITTSVAGAHRRAKIQQATVEAQEMTKAILSYENFGKNYSLDAHVMEDQQATEQSLAFILGKESAQIKGQRGDIPVLFNAAVKKDGADNSFECVGKYGGLFAPACVFLSVAQKQILAQFQLLCNDVQRGFANGTCARAGHHALVHFGVIQI